MNLSVQFSDLAWEQWQALTGPQLAQARRLIAAIQLAPGVGRLWNQDLRGRRYRVVSAADTHLVYRIVYQRSGDVLLIAAILIYDTPPDPNN